MLYGVFAALGAALLALDQWFKAWVVANLPLGETMPFLPGIMQLRTVHNYGAAWSSFSGMRWLLIAVTSAIVLTILYFVVRGIVRHPLGLFAASLVISGGLGNIIDRLRFGYVVDMFDLTFMNYPVFNIADICIVCGCVVGCAYYLWFYEKYDKKDLPHGEADAADK
ncbi:MAG: signal peptidase II [Oscillibacter sp.]|nr:signal peptidase II [Oscillibacter sp.]